MTDKKTLHIELKCSDGTTLKISMNQIKDALTDKDIELMTHQLVATNALVNMNGAEVEFIEQVYFSMVMHEIIEL